LSRHEIALEIHAAFIYFFTMKTTFNSRRMIAARFSLCVVFLLVGAVVSLAPAQSTNNATPAQTDPSLLFPSLDQLPGKVPPHVWPGLANAWRGNRTRFKAAATRDTGAVVFLGDSITQGWNTLAKDFPNLKVANRGIGGDITSGVLYRLQADVLDLNPSGIVLLIGTNDIGDGSTPEDVAANIRQILLAIKKFNPNLKVIVCKIMPTEDGKPNVEKIKQANDLVEQFVKTEPNFVMCETFGIYLDEQGHQIAADFKTDHLHPVAAGYVVWKSALDPLMAQLNWSTAKTN
jgi:lysophospholipase L1-like esterase